MVGTVERRILLSYRADPDVVARQLPVGFQPHVEDGVAVVGVCCIRLRDLRPARMSARLGLTFESLAHRAAVERDGVRGVYIWRRDTASRLVTAAGGRVFPTRHHHGRFRVADDDGILSFHYRSDTHDLAVDFEAKETDALAPSSLFCSVKDAESFFRADSVGWSQPNDEVELVTGEWRTAALSLGDVRCSFFDDERRFPADSLELDSALILREVDATWRRPTAA